MNAATTTGGYATTTSSSTATTSTQRLVRLTSAASPFVWRGLLPLLGLLALTWFAVAPYAANDIEATVAREVRGELQRKGFGWVNVAASGQDVLLSGTPPAAAAGDEALATARAATCPTWAGPKICAVTVLGAFASPAAANMPVVPAPAATAPTPSPAAVACEAALAKLLATSRIEFASGGSAIDARSDKLLDQLALAARGCPGRILVEGHTDNVGDPAANQRLSEARAGAVRDALVRRGIPAVRLEALGYGEAKPLADNSSEAGRAANRRIDFKALP